MPDALVSYAAVVTPTPERYAKQLVSHLGHKATVGPLVGGPAGAGLLLLSRGVGVVVPADGRLLLQAFAGTADDLALVQDVIARHLVRFGARQELTVEWKDSLGAEAEAEAEAEADADDPATSPE